MPFLGRMAVGCVIPDKETLNKNKLSKWVEGGCSLLSSGQPWASGCS